MFFMLYKYVFIFLSHYFLLILLYSAQIGLLYLSLYQSHLFYASIYDNCKNSQVIQVQRASGYRVTFSYHILTPYPQSQGGEIFGHKYNQNTLNPWESDNSTSPSLKPLTFRGSRKTSFHLYNLLTLITLHTN